MLTLQARDYRVLEHLIYRGFMTYESTITWAFNQYTDDGIDPIVEKIGLAIDLDEILSLINDYSKISKHEVITTQFLLGEARAFYENPKLRGRYQEPVYDVKDRYVEEYDIHLPFSERSTLLSITNYFGDYDYWEPKNRHWQAMDKHRNENWIEFIELCQIYKPYYLDAIRIFEIENQS